MYFSGSYNLILFVCEEWKLLLVLTLAFLLYHHYTSTFSFFEEKGVKFMKPTIILGNLGSRLRMKISFHDFQLEIYQHFKGHPYGGIFEGRRPVLYIFDSELIKAIGIRDFDHFVDRSTLTSYLPRFWSRSLINLKGSEWKTIRSILTPTFSSARLRLMLPLIEQCSKQMVDFFKGYDKADVEMKDKMGHFTLEVIGSCAFGIQCDALKDGNAEFLKVANNFMYMPKMKRILIFFFLMFMPKMIRFFKISFLNMEACRALVKTLAATKAERRKSKMRRNDFLQILIDAAENEENVEGSNTKQLDDDTIDAQSLLFLFAGFETSSTLLSVALHVLATKPELQDRLREHVATVRQGREITYEILAEMTYLEAFLMETQRMYPPVARVDRVCTKKYTIPNTSVEVNPGDVVVIPVYGIHMDPDFYPEPEQFRVERFLGEERKNRPSHHFLAFGIGPRNCIGLRFAMMSAKIAMVHLLQNFRFLPCDKTVDPIQFDKKGILLKSEKGLWVKLELLSN